jgi:hypothetical protein
MMEKPEPHYTGAGKKGAKVWRLAPGDARLSLDTRRQMGIMRLVRQQKRPAKICFYARLAAIMLAIA